MALRRTAEERRSEIVSAALRLADALGPDRLTTEVIAAEVGVSQPAIFRHFRTKQAIWLAVADNVADRMTAAWDDVLDRPSGPVERIGELVSAQLRLIEATPAIPAILFSRELHVENEGLRARFLELVGRFHQTIAGEVRRAQGEGEMTGDIDPNDIAFLLIGLVQGLALRWSLSRRRFGLEAEGARLLAVQLTLLGQSAAAGTGKDRS
ncbi:AcrR family transcriptional regulator [Amaricoccus macauensis]|uniref:AcrR family transcriptional regulator n=1 Tax=Amaricoccus macauensis TaxID=57001 RepID=A0A840SMQ5_9RHOB|nr:TetR/AcrR family transcriptional regulator [Amaricoccus macauensis]MBB5221875.1 AcrR family transcriptional regulator [Amaricoccus macauensis]